VRLVKSVTSMSSLKQGLYDLASAKCSADAIRVFPPGTDLSNTNAFTLDAVDGALDDTFNDWYSLHVSKGNPLQAFAPCMRSYWLPCLA